MSSVIILSKELIIKTHFHIPETTTNTYDEARSGYYNRGQLTTALRSVPVSGTMPAVNVSRQYNYDLAGRLAQENHLAINGQETGRQANKMKNIAEKKSDRRRDWNTCVEKLTNFRVSFTWAMQVTIAQFLEQSAATMALKSPECPLKNGTPCLRGEQLMYPMMHILQF